MTRARLRAAKPSKMTSGSRCEDLDAKIAAGHWGGTLWPILRLECIFEIGGETASVYTHRVRAAVPETPFKNAAAAEKRRCAAAVEKGEMTAEEAARRGKQIARLLRLARDRAVPVIKRTDEGFQLLKEIAAGKDASARLKALEAALEARKAEQ